MAFSKKIKLIGVGVFLLLLVIGVGLFVLFSVRGYKKVERFRRAVEAYEGGEYQLARPQLLAALGEDPNNERAVVMLAEIYRQEGNWPAEAYFRERAVSLNPLSTEYPALRDRAELMGGDYNRLYTRLALQLKTKGVLDDTENQLYILSALRTNHSREAEAAWKAATAKNPAFGGLPPLGELLTVMFELPNLKREERLSKFAALVKSADPAIAFEGLRMLTLHYRFNGGTVEQQENTLKKAAVVNRLLGEPALAEFYNQRYRFDEAIAIYEKYLVDYPSIGLSAVLAELYVFTNRRDKLTALSEKFRSGSKQVLMTGYYMDALGAFMDNDLAKMVAALDGTENAFGSPLGSLLALRVAIYRNQLSDVQRLARRFLGRPSFLNINRRATEMLHGYVQLLLRENNAADAAKIAQLIYSPSNPDMLLTRVLMRDRLLRNLLDDASIAGALKSFPDDPFLLQLAAEYYLGRGQFAKVLEQVDLYRSKIKEENPGIELMRVMALEQTGKLDEAFSEFRRIIEKNPDNVMLLGACFEMAWRHGRRQELAALAAYVAGRKEPAIREFAPYMEAEFKLLDGDLEGALKLLADADSTLEPLLFRAAFLLGQNDRFAPAIRNYEKILANFPESKNRSLILINLSELFAASGDRKRALELAADAWKLAPDDPNVRFCYASRLLEEKDYAAILDVLKLPRFQSRVPERQLKIWETAVTERIKQVFEHKNYDQTLDLCRHLQIYFPDSPVAREYLEKVKAAREQEK